MILLWVFTGVSLVTALVAWSHARRTARRLEQLSTQYWELRYQYGELRVHVQRLTGHPAPPPSSIPPPDRAGEAFVPLSSLKR
jgi:hypothetical protein